MNFIAISGTATSDETWKDYKEDRDDLYDAVGSDAAYEAIMNGLAYLDENNQVVYYE